MAATRTLPQPPRGSRHVVITSFLLVLGFGIWGLLQPNVMTDAAVGMVDFVLRSTGWMYLALCSGFLVLSAWLVFGPYGDVRLETGEVDALMPMLEQGHAGLMKLLHAGGLRVVNVRAFRGNSPALRYPFLRPAKIPADTYPGQTEPIDTVAAQVVLATRVPLEKDPIGESGPGFIPGVFTRLPQRLPFDTALRLSEALGVSEEVDPVLPASPGLRPETPSVRPPIHAEPASALLNVLAILFLVAMVVLLFRDLPTNPALKGGDKRPERD